MKNGSFLLMSSYINLSAIRKYQAKYSPVTFMYTLLNADFEIAKCFFLLSNLSLISYYTYKKKENKTKRNSTVFVHFDTVSLVALALGRSA